MAGTTGLEPATSDVTGRRSNQLNYDPALEAWLPWDGNPRPACLDVCPRRANHCPHDPWWAVQDSNLRQPACKAGALPLS